MIWLGDYIQCNYILIKVPPEDTPKRPQNSTLQRFLDIRACSVPSVTPRYTGHSAPVYISLYSCGSAGPRFMSTAPRIILYNRRWRPRICARPPSAPRGVKVYARVNARISKETIRTQSSGVAAGSGGGRCDAGHELKKCIYEAERCGSIAPDTCTMYLRFRTYPSRKDISTYSEPVAPHRLSSTKE